MIMNAALLKDSGNQVYGIEYRFDMGIDLGLSIPQKEGSPGELISTVVAVPLPKEHTVTIRTTKGDFIPSHTTITSAGKARVHTIVFVMPKSDVVITGTAVIEPIPPII